MEQLDRIWAATRENMRPNMTGLSFHAWIDVIRPVAVQNDILILEVPSADIQKTLMDFFFSSLVHSAKLASPTILDVKLVLPEESENYSPRELPQEPVPVNALNPKNTFDTFVVGSSNHFAHAASQAVAQNPAAAYNPLFLYGGVGLGKTHLMHAIGHHVKAQNPSTRVMYVTSETFTNELITAIQTDQRQEFRKKYRNVDVLLIDDIQFIAKKQAVQEEFFNTFNTLHNADKQIVISSDRPPKEINQLEERLRSRFEWGLIADIQPPDVETRTAILRNKARLDNIQVPDEIINFIAEHVHSNIRELEGCLTRAVAFSNFKREPLTLELTKTALKDLLPDIRKKDVDPMMIKETVAAYYGVTVESLHSQRRDREIVLPRQVAMYLCHNMLSLPYLRIAYLFDRNDHTTAINACRKVTDMIISDPAFKQVIEDLKKRIEA
ncbi:MAG: chromosomal replication initiator protein DnaA [Clostridia bacterium]|nr:chromosomal replication initiator protein DnaA [Clostridia bacterium]